MHAVRAAGASRGPDLPSPAAGPGEVVISVKAASVNFPDFLIIQNKYQFKPELPFSPGSELTGVVKEVGPGVTGVAPGDRVMAFTTYGAFREEVKVEPGRILPLPEGMDFNTGAAFLLTYGTMDHGLRDRGALKAGETVLVLGASGGIGIASIEIAKALGARVIACASDARQARGCADSMAPMRRSTTAPKTCASGSRRSPRIEASTSSSIRWAGRIRNLRCGPAHGEGVCSWSVLRLARFRRSRST